MATSNKLSYAYNNLRSSGGIVPTLATKGAPVNNNMSLAQIKAALLGWSPSGSGGGISGADSAIELILSGVHFPDLEYICSQILSGYYTYNPEEV